MFWLSQHYYHWINLLTVGMSLQTEWPGIAQCLGGVCWGGSWEIEAVPEGAGCFSLYLASGTGMAYSFPQSKKGTSEQLGWLLMRLFCLFIHFKIYMPYFSLRPSGHLCLIRLEGLQFEITYAAWCPISLCGLGNKVDYCGFMCKQIRDRCRHSCKPYSCLFFAGWIPPSPGSFYIKWHVYWL